MSIKNWMKPSYIKAEFLRATKQGWCYTKNNNEVIIALPHLPARLESQGLDPETGEQLEAPINKVLPIVTGIAKAGNTLTSTNGDWTSKSEVEYQTIWEYSITANTWVKLSETSNNLVLAESNVGQNIRFTVTAINETGSTTVSSAQTSKVITSIINPSNTAVPVLSGTAKAGNTLSVTNGTWSGTAPITYTYKWEESTNGTTWSSYSGTNNSIALTESNVGKRYRVEVTGTNAGSSAKALSNVIGPIVTALVAPVNTGVPTVSGTAKAGNTLTTTDGTWTGSPTITYTYAWESSPNGTTWTAVAGQTNKTLALTEANVGLRYRSKVSAKNSQGTVVANSAASAAVVTALIAPSNTVAPVLSGNPEVGSVLSVTNGTWAGSPTINYTYNWKSSTDGVSFTSTGTTTSNYTLVESDVDKTFQVEVTGTNTVGNTKATSNSIGPVTNIELEPQE